MLERKTLMAYLTQMLTPDRFEDYCPNGLQVEGKSTIQKIVTGVSASRALIEKGIQAGADLILVHHGFFWKNEPLVLTGVKYQRIKLLIDHEINLVAFHLPLDAHPTVGNNARLAALLNLKITGPLVPEQQPAIGNIGVLEKSLSLADFAALINKKLDREPLLISGGSHPIKTVGFCTGAAQGALNQAIEQGVDAYLTGEVSENTVHLAREAGVHFLGCGHHATERYGVQALGEDLKARFGIVHEFIEIPNPV